MNALPLRVRNADILLLEFALTEEGRPFVWGETDCASLIRRGVAVFFGADLFPDAPNWSTTAGALRAQQETGGVRAAVLALGAVVKPLPFFHTGDVVLGPETDDEGFPFAGLVVHGRVLTAIPGGSVLLHPLSDCPPGSEVLRWTHG